MLVALRNKSSNFVMKLMLLFLAFSFALWGVGDIFRQGQPSVVAKVGTNKISGMDFARMIDRVANDKMPREMLKNPMILNQVLSGMINEQLILQESKRLGIRVGDEQAFKYISQDSLFKGASGKFDKEIFRRVLQSNNLSETGYIENLKTDLAANILLESYYVAELAPAAVVDAVASVRRQLREVEFVIIPTSAVATPTTADDAVIEAFYQKNIGAYTSAEMREISLVTLDRKLHTPKTEISEEELKKNYEEHKEEYRTAETRDVSHISFKNEDAAKKAFQALSSGASLETVAKEFSALNQGTLGKVTLKDMPEGTGAPVFTIKQGEYTQPVKRPFGWQIFHVSAVVPGKYKTLEEVRPALVEAIHALSNEEALQKIINQLEDELAGGATMQEAASKFNLPLAKLGPTTRDGKDAKGAALSGVPAIENLLETAFALDEGVESPVTRSKDGNFFLVKTEKVIKAEPTPLNSIKQEVTKAYLAQEKEKALATFAEDVSKRLIKGEKPSDISPAITVENAGNIKSTGSNSSSGRFAKISLPEGLARDVFRMKRGEYGMAYLAPDAHYVVPHLKNIMDVPAPQGEDAELDHDNLRADIAKQYRQELYEHYIEYLKKRYAVKINDQAFKSFTETPEQ